MSDTNLLDKTDVWGKIEQMILPIGTDEFTPVFYDTCRNLFANDQCNIFVFDKGLDSSPFCAFSTASENKMRQLTREMSREYVAKGFKFDPMLDWVKSRGLTRRNRHVRVISGRQIGNEHYRDRFYDHALVRQKMTMVSHTESMVIYQNFYRNPDQPDFGQGERQLLEIVGGTLSNLMQKHIYMTYGRRNEDRSPAIGHSPEFREQLQDRVRHMLLAENNGLTPREADVCSCIAIGMTTDGIASTHGISANTVATHRKRAYAKLGISSQSDLFARYYNAVAHQIRTID